MSKESKAKVSILSNSTVIFKSDRVWILKGTAHVLFKYRHLGKRKMAKVVSETFGIPYPEAYKEVKKFMDEVEKILKGTD